MYRLRSLFDGQTLQFPKQCAILIWALVRILLLFSCRDALCFAAAYCFSESDTLKWSRTFNFDNRLLTLKIAVSDDPAHWIVNYLFEILARERLGYKQIEFVRVHNKDIKNAVHQLTCGEPSCETLPVAHLNLLLWLPIGIDVHQWAPSSDVSDHGPLGPIRQWELMTQSEFVESRVPNRTSFSEPSSCSQQSPVGLDTLSKLINKESQSIDSQTVTEARKQPVKVYELQLDGTTLRTHSFTWTDPPLCRSFTSSETSGSGKVALNDTRICRTESDRATKVSWAKLGVASPPLFKLASQIHLATDEFAELLRQVREIIESLPISNRLDDHVRIVYRENACRWLRRNPSRWKKWTEGWNQKLNLTVAGMFSVYGKWILPGLQEAAEVAIRFVNEDPDYFLHSEYALKLDVRNLSCEPGVVLSEYFNLLAGSTENRLIGSIAALCSDSIEAMVELANMRKKLIISPTVATARFLEQQHYPYFFRTIPAMTEANFVLLRLFLKWGWRRVAVFRKRDHFFNPLLFQAEDVQIIADIQDEENRLIYESAENSLENLKQMNSRIFVIEYDARGTYLILCAAYRLGMHFGAGYVWFLNPWLSGNWWAQPSLTSLNNCTYDEMANITSWTFTVGHQWIIPQMLHSFTRLSIPSVSSSESRSQPDVNLGGENSSPTNEPSETGDSHLNRSRRHALYSSQKQLDSGRSNVVSGVSLSVPPTRPPMQHSSYDPTAFYLAYTTDAVMTLASALINLLKENPSAVSALDQPNVAEAFRNWVARTEFGYGGIPNPKDKQGAREEFFLGFGFQAAGEFYGLRDPISGGSSTGRPRLRFNSLNERIADHWLLKQRRVNTTVPIFVWFTNSDPVDDEAENHSPDDIIKTSLTTANNQTADLLEAFAHFERKMKMVPKDNVNWSVLGGPPHDGSVVEESCVFPFLSDTLRMGCTGAIIFVAVVTSVFSLVPIILASLHYRRKLREAEKRTRKPFDELCAELADLDMPVETIVLNRQIGQGAFGLVFGGEAKNQNRWEAVAVKVINEKATYEGKIDFLSEAKLMRSLKHPNVVRLIGISLGQKENLYLVMELMLLGDLKTYLLSRRILAQRSPDHEDIRPATLTQMSIHIAQGLSYLHNKHLIHRDIACRNCLVGTDHLVKIGDFGLTREASKNKPESYYRFTRNCELPIRWMSPEAVQYGIFSIQSDIWSYGITLYEIVTFGVFPYSDMGDVEVVERVKRMEFSISDFLPAAARNTIVWRLIRHCCQHQWKNRPSSMQQVLQVLFDYPECIRPFLTDDPPKPVMSNEPLPFQTVVGPRIFPETLISGPALPDAFPCRPFQNNTSVASVPLTESLPLKYRGHRFADDDLNVPACPAEDQHLDNENDQTIVDQHIQNKSDCDRASSSENLHNTASVCDPASFDTRRSSVSVIQSPTWSSGDLLRPTINASSLYKQHCASLEKLISPTSPSNVLSPLPRCSSSDALLE